jgi:hypothetical protein
LPTHQSLDPDHPSIDLRQRLVVKAELVARDGGGKSMLDGAPLALPVVHFDLKEARLAATGGLGAGERLRQCRRPERSPRRC